MEEQKEEKSKGMHKGGNFCEQIDRSIQIAKPFLKQIEDAERNIRPFLEQIEQAERNIKSIKGPAEEAIKRFRFMYDQAAVSIKNIQPMMENVARQFQSFRESESFKQIQEYAERVQKEHQQLSESFRKSAESWDKVNKICFELGWFPYNRWGSDAGRIILKLYKEKKVDQLNNEICDFYNERILEIANKWDDFDNVDKRRLKIIKQAIAAHLNSHFETSIIVLLTQIEGQIRDELLVQKRINHSSLLKEYKGKLKKKESQSLQEVYVDIIFSSMLKKLYESHGYTKKVNSIWLTRHSVLHGFFLGPYDRIQSTKLILLLNFVITTDIWIK